MRARHQTPLSCFCIYYKSSRVNQLVAATAHVSLCSICQADAEQILGGSGTKFFSRMSTAEIAGRFSNFPPSASHCYSQPVLLHFNHSNVSPILTHTHAHTHTHIHTHTCTHTRTHTHSHTHTHSGLICLTQTSSCLEVCTCYQDATFLCDMTHLHSFVCIASRSRRLHSLH